MIKEDAPLNTSLLRLMVWSALVLSPLSQFLYFYGVYRHSSAVPDQAQVVLIYSGGDDRSGKTLEWAKQDPKCLFLCSGWDYSLPSLTRSLAIPRGRILVEDRSRTTDQNARYSALLVRKLGVPNAVLALPWYQLPRALFLTRYYLRNAGTKVVPYATLPLPDHWWMNPLFHLEMVKFWGSLGRVALAWVGVEDWPKPQLIRSVP